MASLIPIHSIYGNTIQGEGRHIGRPVTVVRVAGCSLRCDFCDTKYAWKIRDEYYTPIDEIAGRVRSCPATTVLLTGGDPAEYDCHELIAELSEFDIHCETQGAKHRAWFSQLDYLTISPKRRVTYHQVRNCTLSAGRSVWPARAELKFVMFDLADIEWVSGWLEEFPEVAVTLQIGHTGKSRETYTDAVRAATELLAAYPPDRLNFRILPQLHKILWHEERNR